MVFKFPLDSDALALWLSVNATAENDVWQVRSLELYSDDSYSLPSLVAELQFARLPHATQAQLLDWIEREYQARRFHQNAMQAHDLMVKALKEVAAVKNVGMLSAGVQAKRIAQRTLQVVAP